MANYLSIKPEVMHQFLSEAEVRERRRMTYYVGKDKQEISTEDVIEYVYLLMTKKLIEPSKAEGMFRRFIDPERVKIGSAVGRLKWQEVDALFKTKHQEGSAVGAAPSRSLVAPSAPAAHLNLKEIQALLATTPTTKNELDQLNALVRPWLEENPENLTEDQKAVISNLLNTFREAFEIDTLEHIQALMAKQPTTQAELKGIAAVVRPWVQRNPQNRPAKELAVIEDLLTSYGKAIKSADHIRALMAKQPSTKAEFDKLEAVVRPWLEINSAKLPQEEIETMLKLLNAYRSFLEAKD